MRNLGLTVTVLVSVAVSFVSTAAADTGERTAVMGGMMEVVTLALVQHACPVGHRDENLAATLEWVRKARESGADIVCFPELNITGHAGHGDMTRFAEPVPGGPSCTTLEKLAAGLGIYVCAGIAEDERGIHYNTMFIVGPDGYVGKQRKVHLSRDEYFYFRGGTDLPVFDLPFARLGIAICYDNEVPEVQRCLAVKGAELILAPHAARFGSWPDDRGEREKAVRRQKDSWSLVHRCRARDNGVFVALCNVAGRSATDYDDVEANHAGACMVFDPKGGVWAESAATDIVDEMLVTILDGRMVHERRNEKCFNLRTRRPEVFGALTAPTK